LSIVVSDSFVDKTIKAITDSGATGEIGDGKIFIYNCEEAYRIRTGETGNQSFN
jgi:nitrogen regulatory protein P-II 1